MMNLEKIKKQKCHPPTLTACLRRPARDHTFTTFFNFSFLPLPLRRAIKIYSSPSRFLKKKKGGGEGGFWTMISYISFLCIFKLYIQNQSKQCVKGSYIIRYWSTVDGMWRFIYYHLDVNKGCWEEKCNHNFQPLKLIKQDFSNFLW